ncbi:ATP-grasp domain-containing protein, partial [Actinokineospora sp.]|uniref:ATP-grasp domain-containing protein n=1 Tax=Actinokineospora sp. TaxID=1872133 RepID=UPI00403778E8
HHGWPIVIKPRAESSSAGVVIAHRPTDIQMPANAMVQAFHPGRIYYVDGVFDGTRLDIWTASRYLQSCVDFRSGSVLGGVQEDDPEILDRVGAFAERALRALSNQPVVVHLELFVDGDRCAFLEVGARVGGGEIPFLWREVHGYDLMAAAFQIAIGQRPQPVLPFDRGGEITGELLAPAPARRPCRILEATPMVGRVPCLYAEDLLRPGDVLPNADAYYEHVGGRFRFRGPTSAAVEAAIEATAREFRVRAEPLPVAAAA